MMNLNYIQVTQLYMKLWIDYDVCRRFSRYKVRITEQATENVPSAKEKKNPINAMKPRLFRIFSSEFNVEMCDVT